MLGVGGEGGAGNLHYARHIEHTAPELFCEKILRQTSVSNGIGRYIIAGQRDRCSFIVPGQRDKLKILPRDGIVRACPVLSRDAGQKRDKGTADKDVFCPGTKGQRDGNNGTSRLVGSPTTHVYLQEIASFKAR